MINNMLFNYYLVIVLFFMLNNTDIAIDRSVHGNFLAYIVVEFKLF